VKPTVLTLLVCPDESGSTLVVAGPPDQSLRRGSLPRRVSSATRIAEIGPINSQSGFLRERISTERSVGFRPYFALVISHLAHLW
jgi:hypothetical protein